MRTLVLLASFAFVIALVNSQGYMSKRRMKKPAITKHPKHVSGLGGMRGLGMRGVRGMRRSWGPLGRPVALKDILGKTITGKAIIGGITSRFPRHGGAGRGRPFANGLRNGWGLHPDQPMHTSVSTWIDPLDGRQFDHSFEGGELVFDDSRGMFVARQMHNQAKQTGAMLGGRSSIAEHGMVKGAHQMARGAIAGVGHMGPLGLDRNIQMAQPIGTAFINPNGPVAVGHSIKKDGMIGGGVSMFGPEPSIVGRGKKGGYLGGKKGGYLGGKKGGYLGGKKGGYLGGKKGGYLGGKKGAISPIGNGVKKSGRIGPIGLGNGAIGPIGIEHGWEKSGTIGSIGLGHGVKKSGGIGPIGLGHRAFGPIGLEHGLEKSGTIGSIGLGHGVKKSGGIGPIGLGHSAIGSIGLGNGAIGPIGFEHGLEKSGTMGSIGLGHGVKKSGGIGPIGLGHRAIGSIGFGHSVKKSGANGPIGLGHGGSGAIGPVGLSVHPLDPFGSPVGTGAGGIMHGVSKVTGGSMNVGGIVGGGFMPPIQTKKAGRNPVHNVEKVLRSGVTSFGHDELASNLGEQIAMEVIRNSAATIDMGSNGAVSGGSHLANRAVEGLANEAMHVAKEALGIASGKSGHFGNHGIQTTSMIGGIGGMGPIGRRGGIGLIDQPLLPKKPILQKKPVMPKKPMTPMDYPMRRRGRGMGRRVRNMGGY